MPQVLLCPRGHRSEVSTDAGVSSGTPLLCPVCGVRVEPSTEAETIPPLEPMQSADTASVVAVQRCDAPIIPGFEVLDELGRGGMGIVYRARQPHLDRLVAIKVLPADASKESSFTERFTREARALARLNHPHILTVYDFGQADGQSYFVMEYVDGTNLRQRLRAGPLPQAETVRIVSQVCEALAYAHDEGIVHRDIKPENVLLDRRGRVKIGDFGIAKLLTRKAGDYTLTGPWQVMGTFHYMAPEQLENPQQLDQRADIYSVGVMLYELLTGGLPQGRFPLPSQKMGTDPRLDAIVLKALDKEPAGRYQTASELKAALDGVQNVRAEPPVAVAIPIAEIVDKTAVLPAPGMRFSTPEAWAARVRKPARCLLFAGFVSIFPTAVYWFLRSLDIIPPASHYIHMPTGGVVKLILTLIMTSSPAGAGAFSIIAGLALYHRRYFWLTVLGCFVTMQLYSLTNWIGVPVGLYGIITVSRLRRTYRLPPWPTGTRLPPLLPEWMSNVHTWYLVCSAVGLFFCVQPFWPWVEVPLPAGLERVQGPGGWFLQPTQAATLVGYGYRVEVAVYAAGAFSAFFLFLFVTGRMAIRRLWYTVAALCAGMIAGLILFLGLNDTHVLLSAVGPAQHAVSQEDLHICGPAYWALAMGVVLFLLGALQLRALLTPRR